MVGFIFIMESVHLSLHLKASVQSNLLDLMHFLTFQDNIYVLVGVRYVKVFFFSLKFIQMSGQRLFYISNWYTKCEYA